MGSSDEAVVDALFRAYGSFKTYNESVSKLHRVERCTSEESVVCEFSEGWWDNGFTTDDVTDSLLTALITEIRDREVELGKAHTHDLTHWTSITERDQAFGELQHALERSASDVVEAYDIHHNNVSRDDRDETVLDAEYGDERVTDASTGSTGEEVGEDSGSDGDGDSDTDET